MRFYASAKFRYKVARLVDGIAILLQLQAYGVALPVLPIGFGINPAVEQANQADCLLDKSRNSVGVNTHTFPLL